MVSMRGPKEDSRDDLDIGGLPDISNVHLDASVSPSWRLTLRPDNGSLPFNNFVELESTFRILIAC